MVLPKRKRSKKSGTSHKKARPDFLAAWLRAPLMMGAIMPSSRALAQAMAKQVDAADPGWVVELGAGTGVVTYALLEAGIDPKRLLVIEREPKLFAILEAQFPQVNVVCADAVYLNDILAKFGNPKISAIVSSLPMITLPKKIEQAIQEQMAALVGEGKIVQFTFGAKSPLNRVKLRQQGISGKRVKLVLANVPPAHVWVYRRE